MSIINIKEEYKNSVLSIEEIKNFLRIDFDNDDIMLEKALFTATRQAELTISKTLNKKQYVYSFFNQINKIVKLKFEPIINIDSVSYIDNYNTNIIIDLKNYIFDEYFYTISFKNLPTTFQRLDITYTAGYDIVPEDLKQALLFHIAKIYEDKSGFYPIPKASNIIYKNYKKIKI